MPMLDRVRRAEIAILRAEAREAIADYRLRVDAICEHLGITTRRHDYELRQRVEAYCDGGLSINALVLSVRVHQARQGVPTLVKP